MEFDYAKCGEEILKEYIINKNKDTLKDAVCKFTKAKEHKKLLDNLIDIERKTEDVIFEICKASIFINNSEILNDNIKYLSDFYKIKLIKYFKNQGIELEEIKKEISYSKKINRFKVLSEKFQGETRLNELVSLYYSYDLFKEIVEIYNGKKEFKYSKESRKYIAKSLDRLEYTDEAARIYIEDGNYIESIKVYEKSGEWKKIYDLSKIKIEEKEEVEDRAYLVRKLINSALKIKELNMLSYASEVSKISNYYRQEDIKIEIYKLTGDVDKLLQVLQVSLRLLKKESIEYFELEREKLITLLTREELEIIAKEYSERGEKEKAIEIYRKIDMLSKIVDMLDVKEERKDIIKIYEENSEIFCEEFNGKVIEAYKNEGKIEKIVEYPIRFKKLNIAIEILYKLKEKEKIIKLYKENMDYKYNSENYLKIIETLKEEGEIIKCNDIYIYDLKMYIEAIELAIKENNFNELKRIDEILREKEIFLEDIIKEKRELILRVATLYKENHEEEKALKLLMILKNEKINDIIEIFYKLEKFKPLIELSVKNIDKLNDKALLYLEKTLEIKAREGIKDKEEVLLENKLEKVKNFIIIDKEIERKIEGIIKDKIKNNISIDIEKKISLEKKEENIKEEILKRTKRLKLETQEILDKAKLKIKENKVRLKALEEKIVLYKKLEKRKSLKEESVKIKDTLIEENLKLVVNNEEIVKYCNDIEEALKNKLKEGQVTKYIEEEIEKRREVKVVIFSEKEKREKKVMGNIEDSYFKAAIDITINLIEMGFSDEQIIEATKGILTSREIEIIKYAIN